jgi:hypothetical protein
VGLRARSGCCEEKKLLQVMAKCKLLLYHPNYAGLKILHMASNSSRVLYKLMVNSHDHLLTLVATLRKWLAYVLW